MPIAEALVSSQSKVKALTKSKTNPHFKSKYVPLDALIEAMQPILAEHKPALNDIPPRIAGHLAISINPHHHPGDL